jgi:phage/plasmid-associated DNA primase
MSFYAESKGQFVPNHTGPANDDSPIKGLSAHHYQMLHAESGITDDVIRASGCRSLGAKEAEATLRILGFSNAQCRLGAGLLLRLTPPDDSIPLWQFRPDDPRDGENGKPCKYEIPAGARQRLITHPQAMTTLRDASIPLYVTEGAKKVYALLSHGVAAFGLIGVWNFAEPRSETEKGQHLPKTLLPDWRTIALAGRRANIVFDSDAAHNEQVQQAERELAELLSAQGALVSIARLPAGNGGQKQGIDDFLAHGGTITDLQALVMPYATKESIVAWLDATPADGRMKVLMGAMPRLSTIDPLDWMQLKPELKGRIPTLNMNDLERAWAQKHRDHIKVLEKTGRLEGQTPTQDRIASGLAELWHGETVWEIDAQEWMVYCDGVFKRADAVEIEQRIARHMDEKAPGYTANVLTGVTRLLRARVATKLPMETPGWVPFQNGALDLATMMLHLHTPARPFLWQLPYDYVPGADCPLTQAFLLEAVNGDPLQVQLLRAFIKAVVTRRADLQRYLENIGPAGTGKGTYMRILHAIAGDENTFVTELKYLETNRFETSGLRHKLLMLVTDAERYSGPVNQLKAITGQDTIRMEEKFKRGGKAYAPAMVCITANEPIQSADYTSGLTRRRIAMSFQGKPTKMRALLAWENGQWGGELAPEISGIFNWAMGIDDAEVYRLLKETDAAVPQLAWLAHKAIIDTNPLADWANTHLVFADKRNDAGELVERVNVGTARRAEHSDRYECEDIWLYPNYRAWTDGTGNRPISMRRFAALLEDLLCNQIGLPAEYRQDWTGSHFRGIRMRTASDNAESLICPPKPAPVTDEMDTLMDETRTTDGLDGLDGLSENQSIDPPTHPVPDKGEVGGTKGRSANPENPSKSIASIRDAGVSHLTSVWVSNSAPKMDADSDALTDKDACPHCEQRRLWYFKPGQLVCRGCGEKTLTAWQG